MVNVGIAGIGFMGMIHYLSYQKVRGAKVVAFCETNEKRLAGDWRGIQGNFGPAGKKMDLSGTAKYTKIEDMLADPKVDMVDVCLPPVLHPEVTIKSLKAGKDVFCEKPIALTVRDAKRMTAVAEKEGKVLNIGHVLPMFQEYAQAYKLIQSGKYGRLLGGNFKRIGANPAWLKGYFDPEMIGGPLFDLHVHDAHFIRLICGMPDAVFTTGRLHGRTEVPEFVNTQLIYEKSDLAVTATCGVIEQQGRSFTHAFEIHLERATLLYDFAVIDSKAKLLTPFTVLDSKGRATEPKLGSDDPMVAFEAEMKEVARSVRTGEASPVLGGQLARDAVILCEKETRSLLTGRIVKV